MIPSAIRVASFTAALLIVLICAVDDARLAAQPTADLPLTLSFADGNYLHRWSKTGQHEFTPKGEDDLSKWNSMVT